MSSPLTVSLFESTISTILFVALKSFQTAVKLDEIFGVLIAIVLASDCLKGTLSKPCVQEFRATEVAI